MLGRVREQGVALLCVIALAFCAAAHAQVEPVTRVHHMSPGRLAAIAAALVGLAGVIVGARALARGAVRSGSDNHRREAIKAIVAGLISVVLGGLVAATSPAGIGTGNGLGGAIVATVVGLVGTLLGVLALARSRHSG